MNYQGTCRFLLTKSNCAGCEQFAIYGRSKHLNGDNHVAYLYYVEIHYRGFVFRLESGLDHVKVGGICTWIRSNITYNHLLSKTTAFSESDFDLMAWNITSVFMEPSEKYENKCDACIWTVYPRIYFPIDSDIFSDQLNLNFQRILPLPVKFFDVVLPLIYSKFRIYKLGPYLVYKANFGLEVGISDSNEMYIRLPSSLMNCVTGFCGDFNNDPGNDNRLSDGTTAVPDGPPDPDSFPGEQVGNSYIEYFLPDPDGISTKYYFLYFW